MSEYGGRASYVENRVLIPVDRVLSSQFPSVNATFTGAQVEILRNIAAYASRLNTYVDDYSSDFYTMPTENDWDTIQAIVADLEEKLMANDNTVFGFNSQLWLKDQDLMPASQQVIHDFGPVPAGEIWVITGISSLCTGNPGTLHVLVKKSAEVIAITDTLNWGPSLYRAEPGVQCILVEGDILRFNWQAIVEGKTVVSMAYGYKMLVPGG